MSREMWKVAVARHGITRTHLTEGAMARHVGIDPLSGDPAVFFEVDPGAKRTMRGFTIFGTGWEIPGDGGHPSPLYVGTANMPNGMVWHIFEVRE